MITLESHKTGCQKNNILSLDYVHQGFNNLLLGSGQENCPITILATEA